MCWLSASALRGWDLPTSAAMRITRTPLQLFPAFLWRHVATIGSIHARHSSASSSWSFVACKTLPVRAAIRHTTSDVRPESVAVSTPWRASLSGGAVVRGSCSTLTTRWEKKRHGRQSCGRQLALLGQRMTAVASLRMIPKMSGRSTPAHHVRSC